MSQKSRFLLVQLLRRSSDFSYLTFVTTGVPKIVPRLCGCCGEAVVLIVSGFTQ